LPNAGKVRQSLLEAIETSSAGGRAVVIDLSALVAVDLSGLQLLCSSHRTAVTRGASLTLGAVPQWFASAAISAGFSRSRSTCPYRRGDICLWSE
jgi:anti-anti-sigma regulatory factor